jgi:hypothetical protein
LKNLAAEDVPDGEDEAGNVEISRWGTPRDGGPAKDHADLGEALGMLDFEAAAKMSGARFAVLKGQLARLERAVAALNPTLPEGARSEAIRRVLTSEWLEGEKLSQSKADDVGTLVNIGVICCGCRMPLPLHRRKSHIDRGI